MVTVRQLVEALSQDGVDPDMPVAVHIPDGFTHARQRPMNASDFALCESAGWVLIDLDGEWEGVW